MGPIHSVLPLLRCSTGRHILDAERREKRVRWKRWADAGMVMCWSPAAQGIVLQLGLSLPLLQQGIDVKTNFNVEEPKGGSPRNLFRSRKSPCRAISKPLQRLDSARCHYRCNIIKSRMIVDFATTSADCRTTSADCRILPEMTYHCILLA